ncbi:MAG: hypothetical protein GY723_03490 [bacterium]|nr:hypothetical protein [bacterium]MCP5069687.1 hypothetical protein [bacterium]
MSEVPIEISLVELRRLRTLHSKGGLHPRIRALLPQVLAEVVDKELLQPAIVWESRKVLGASGAHMRLDGGAELTRAEGAVRLLGKAEEIVMAVGSIGPALDRTTREWFASGREVEAFVLGELGNLAIGKLGDHIPKSIAEWASERGLDTSGALSPGQNGVDLSEQSVVVEVAGAQRIGVELTSACMLAPVKSMSMLIGLGHGLTKWTHAQACELCSSRDTCRLRTIDPEPAVA